MPEQPGEGAAHKRRAFLSRQIPMRNQHTLDRPSENPVQCRSRRTTVEETRAPITRRARIGRDNPAEPSNYATPPLEPVARKVLDQIGEQGGVAVTVKEHDFGQVKAPVQHNLVDVSRPLRLRSVGKRGVECKILALALQPWRSAEAGRRVRGLPFRKEKVVQCVGGDKVPDRARRSKHAASPKAQWATKQTGCR
jgi:hypothetical protein